ncbi:MAG: amino acid permease [Halobacteria archaeon]
MSGQDQELARDLGFLEAYTIGLGTMIGAGIFVLPSIAANQAGPASMVSFLAGGIISLLAAISLSELSTGMPKAGGSYYYVNRALGPFFGSIVGWGMWAGLTFASAFYMIGFGQYLLPGLGSYVNALSGWGQAGITGAALLMAALLTGVNYYGVKETGSLQNIIVLTLVGLILAFLGIGFLSGPTIDEFNPRGWPAVGATIGTVYVTFIGFEVIATSAEEIKNPSRNLPLAMIAAVVTPTLMYVGVMYVSTGTLSIQALADSQIPVADVAKEIMGPIGALLMIVGAILATVSSANASILSAARVNFAMGRDRILINWLNEVHPRFRTPYRAITTTGVITLVLIAIGVGIGTLAEVASFMYLITYALVHVAVVVLRRADPDAYEPSFKIHGLLYPIVPILGLLACIAILLQMSWIVQIIGTVIIIFGILWFYTYARGRAPSKTLVGEAIAPETEEERVTDKYSVIVPVANPQTERDLLRLASANAHAHEKENTEVVAVNVIEVPRQTSLSQDVEFEEERVEKQRELLDSAREIASDLEIGLRTRAIVGRNAGDAILDVIEEENADHVMMGWSGHRSTRDHVLGSTIDQVVGRAECDTSLVKLGRKDQTIEGNVMALAGRGPHAPFAVRRAKEFNAAKKDGGKPSIVNIQPPGEREEGDGSDEDMEEYISPTEKGEELIAEVAEDAGLDEDDYEPRVVVSEDIEEAVVDVSGEYDLVCVGATRSDVVTQTLFGSLPERVGEETEGTVVMARGPKRSPMSIRDGILRRFQEK